MPKPVHKSDVEKLKERILKYQNERNIEFTEEEIEFTEEDKEIIRKLSEDPGFVHINLSRKEKESEEDDT